MMKKKTCRWTGLTVLYKRTNFSPAIELNNEHKYMSYVNLCIYLYYAADLMFKNTHFQSCYMNAIQNSILYY